MTAKGLSVTLLALLLAGCTSAVIPDDQESIPLVSVQVTETKDPGAFERIIAELETRGIRTTVLVDGGFAAQNCERLRALDGAGFELMAFVRPEVPDAEVVTMSMLAYEEQEELLTDVKTAIENCLGKRITGFRPYRFDQNADTYAIADALGFEFNLGFVAHTDISFPGHEDTALPYRAPGYAFWAVPMHSVSVQDRRVAFCDMPFRALVDRAGWEALLKSEFDVMRLQNRPLMVEIHPYYSGVEQDRFEAFVRFLDYAKEHNAEFITTAELAEIANQEN